MLDPPAPTSLSLSAPEVARIPYLPPEIVARILSYYSTHDEAITLLPTRGLIEDEADFNDLMSILSPRELQKALGHRPRGPFQPSTTRMPIMPPFQSHKAPTINLLLTSKLFHDELIKQFYSENIFTFVLGDHDSVWWRASKEKRAHVRHIQLESLWELDVTFFEADHVNQQVKAVFDVNTVWGRSEIEGLTNLDGDRRVIFPNLLTITQRIRLKFNKDWVWPTRDVPDIALTLGDKEFILSEGVDLMIYEGIQDMAKKLLVAEIHRNWADLKTESYLAKMDIGFMYSEILEWDEEVPMVPILSLL